jgi:DNA transformation protein and related proteins
MPPTRGKLRSMASSQGFRDYVLDQLSSLPGVRARAMFGGIGVFAGDLFFAIIANDVLYFKVDDTNRAQYESAGSTAFAPYPDKTKMTMPYHNVPVSVLEDADTLVRWARQSIALVERKKTAKRRAKPSTRR